MSRHRFVKNINVQDELEDDALSDGGEDDIPPEYQEQLETAIAQVRSIVGSESSSGISDKEIRDATWEYYFDVDKTVDWLLEEQNKRAAIRERKAAKEREKMERKAAKATLSQAPSAAASRTASPVPTPVKVKSQKLPSVLPNSRHEMDQQRLDMASLNLQDEPAPIIEEEPPKMSLAREKVLEEARAFIDADNEGRKGINLVVIGHVDAGKSTLMGRLLYELGRVDEKKRTANERASEKLGKGSFSWAWELDGTVEERNRGVTMDIAQQRFSTSNRNITVLDAPGHRDFIPNMISGANQADCALLVVDSSSGEFEAGFQRGGQTKEHLLLVRSLGVSQVVVAVNKLDQVNWDSDRYEAIVEDLRPFLIQAGFSPQRTKFVPVSAMTGINLVQRVIDPVGLAAWYNGPSLVELLDQLEAPPRAVEAPLRIPIQNVFRGQTSSSSGLGVSGRVCSGVVQVGEHLRVLPGDESATVRLIEVGEEDLVPWAAAGSNVTLYLSGIDPIHLSKGSVLCPPTDLVPLVNKFVAQVIIFDIDVPIISGASVELFHHSHDIPATISKLIAIIDRGTSEVIKEKPRVLTKLSAARIEITLRASGVGSQSQALPVPLEAFRTNKEMGRILLRRGGETIAAGIVLELL
ncbi:hypothetical protein M422DRAFT_22749 [Sphaerobolus stellatus SS14]|nr:hypothetical protein M422DRAFT_22749 [Sphaerobolus stellatus SS14]